MESQNICIFQNVYEFAPDNGRSVSLFCASRYMESCVFRNVEPKDRVIARGGYCAESVDVTEGWTTRVFASY